MAIMIGSGEPVARVRRGLDIKGRVALGLDETIVPVATTIDLTAPPIRRSPVRWWSAVTISAVALERAQLRIFHKIAVDQLITGFWVFTATAATLEVGEGLAGAVAGLAARTTELVNAADGAETSRALGIQSVTSTSVAAQLANPLMRVVTPAGGESVFFPVEIVIPAMPDPTQPITNAPAILFESQNVNTLHIITVTGLMFDALPLDFKT